MKSKEEIEYLAKQLCKLSFFEPSKIQIYESR